MIAVFSGIILVSSGTLALGAILDRWFSATVSI